MRILLPVLFAGTVGAKKCINLEQLSCGNINRYTDNTANSAQQPSIEIFFEARGPNVGTVQANHYFSDTCGKAVGDTGFACDDIKSIDACRTSCVSQRACAMKIHPAHCEQGCELDCQPANEAPAGAHVLAADDAWAGAFTAFVIVTVGGQGRTYACEYADTNDLNSAPYCVATMASGHGAPTFGGIKKALVWPQPDTDMDNTGQPYIKFGTETCGASPTLTPDFLTTTSPATAHTALTTPTVGVSTATACPVGQIMWDGSCDGHCGTFSPMSGAGCSATTAAELTGLGPDWKPSTATDCYCSCTTDCRRNGDCCSDYHLCSDHDLTCQRTGIAGPCTQVMTQSPTHHSSFATSGDPFTEYSGKRTQFYLPLGRRLKLLKYGDLELFGEAKQSKKRGDTQQWFKGWEVRYNHTTVLEVEIEPEHVLLGTKPGKSSSQAVSTAAEEEAGVNQLASLKDRLARAMQELSATQKLRATLPDDVDLDATPDGASRKGLRTSQNQLTTLNVTVAGDKVKRETTVTLGNVSIQVTQDAERRVGKGFSEAVWVEAPGIGFVLQSAVAQKFERKEDRIAHAHVNLKFNLINATAATGPLPEIWGVRPMKPTTAKLLEPDQARFVDHDEED